MFGVSTEKQRKKNWKQTFLNKIVKAREEEGINPKEEVSSSSFFSCLSIIKVKCNRAYDLEGFT